VDDLTRAESQAETEERLRHGSSFGTAAAAYAEHRPGYAGAAVRWALEPLAASAIRASVIRASVIRASVIRASVIRASVIRASVIRASVIRVLDLGAGTGKLTATLVGLGAEVTAVEPHPDMLAELRRELPSVRSLPGSAEDIPLPDGGADAVVVGQAMHWFDLLAGHHRDPLPSADHGRARTDCPARPGRRVPL
jgi:SAM-dependent methyltransferase